MCVCVCACVCVKSYFKPPQAHLIVTGQQIGSNLLLTIGKDENRG